MSFYTELSFYRPTPPPAVTCRKFAIWLSRLRDADFIDVRADGDHLQIKFGPSIDADDRPTMWEVPVPGCPGMSTFDEIEWDLDIEAITIDAAIDLLANDNRRIYRAHQFLGAAKPAIVELLQTRRPDDTQPNLSLGDVSISLGPVSACSMAAEAEFHVGWMAVSLSGNGYLWPWGPRDLTNCARRSPGLQSVMKVCSELFPVNPHSRSPLGRKRWPDLLRSRMYIRRRMGDLWPFEQLNVPLDWMWGVAETG